MRISDWSSDVCSSDLGEGRCHGDMGPRDKPEGDNWSGRLRWCDGRKRCVNAAGTGSGTTAVSVASRATPAAGKGAARSEEHTSELQSLMRISYAVFCLKKLISHLPTHIQQAIS